MSDKSVPTSSERDELNNGIRQVPSYHPELIESYSQSLPNGHSVQINPHPCWNGVFPPTLSGYENLIQHSEQIEPHPSVQHEFPRQLFYSPILATYTLQSSDMPNIGVEQEIAPLLVPHTPTESEEYS